MLNGNSGRHAIALLSARRNQRVVDRLEFAAKLRRMEFRKRRNKQLSLTPIIKWQRPPPPSPHFQRIVIIFIIFDNEFISSLLWIFISGGRNARPLRLQKGGAATPGDVREADNDVIKTPASGGETKEPPNYASDAGVEEKRKIIRREIGNGGTLSEFISREININ